MSNAILPMFPGLAWGVSKAPQFTTRVQVAASGRELRANFSAYPKYTFKLAYEVLRRQEYEQLLGFFLARRGSWDSFLFTDPDDNRASNQLLGAGDGNRTRFQLLRTLGGFVEPVENVNAITTVTAGGVVQYPGTHYNLSPTGILLFRSAPLLGAEVRWSGSFYYRCRFTTDVTEYNKFMTELWDMKRLELIGATGNKV